MFPMNHVSDEPGFRWAGLPMSQVPNGPGLPMSRAADARGCRWGRVTDGAGLPTGRLPTGRVSDGPGWR
jgi:hypothetical protein